jgi:O-acetyl-ADP-ribose deacetylase (regulator of RNase III)
MTTATTVKSSSAAINPEAVKPKGKSKNASKGTAVHLQKCILDYREDKTTATKLVSNFRRDCGQVLHANGMDNKDKVKAIKEAYEYALKELQAAMDRDLSRATTLVSIPRGTTGKGGLHHADVVTEMFSAASKKTAIENNTTALKSAGLLK